MQRKSLTLIAVGLTFFLLLFAQMNGAQAAIPQQAIPADEPQPLAQPVRITIRQAIPFSITLLPLSVPLTSTATDVLTDGVAVADTTDSAATPTPAEEPAVDATTAVTDTGSIAVDASAGEVLTDTETVTVPVSDVLTSVADITVPGLLTTVPVTLLVEFDLVVTSTLPTTIPATVTLQLPDLQTATLPVSVTVATLPDGEVAVELLPLPEPEVTPTPTPEPVTEPVTGTTAVEPPTAALTDTAAVTATAPAEPGPAASALPAVDATVAVSANLRAGPSTDSDILGQLGPNAAVQIVATNADGTWYLLTTGAWIANFLVVEQPTGLPVATDEIIAQVTGQAVAPAAEPTATPEPPVAATAVPPTVTTDANVREGPGTEFAVIDGTITGQEIVIVGRNTDGTWFRLDNGGWVSAGLVANAPALDTVPVLNNDGTPVEAAPAAPTTGGLGLLPTPTPTVAVPVTPESTYLAAARAIIGRFDEVLADVDQLVSEARADGALLTNTDWIRRMTGAITLLRGTAIDAQALSVPETLVTIQQNLDAAADSYNTAADALAAAASGADATRLDAAEAAIQQANASLTAAETAIAAAP